MTEKKTKKKLNCKLFSVDSKKSKYISVAILVSKL